MYFEEYLNKIDNNIKLFIDMDGVVADYDFGKAYDYHKKRPLFDNIKKLEKISKKKNIELYILSVTRQNIGYNQKRVTVINRGYSFYIHNSYPITFIV